MQCHIPENLNPQNSYQNCLLLKYTIQIILRCSHCDLTHWNESNRWEIWSASVGSDCSLIRIFVFRLGTFYLWPSTWSRMRKSLLFAWSYLCSLQMKNATLLALCSLHRGQTFIYLSAEPLYEMQVLNKAES